MDEMKDKSPANDFCNIGYRLREMAKKIPHKRAVIFPSGRDKQGRITYAHLTFAQIERESDAFARGLNAIGITQGTRVSVFVRPSLDFIALTFGLFKAGAVPILIDPGMGGSQLLHCLSSVGPEALIGVPEVHLLRILRRKYFRSVKICVTAGTRWLWGGHLLDEIKEYSDAPFELAQTKRKDLAAILFTTGSTGPAKGVEYQHGMFDAQCDLIRETYGIGEDDIDLPTFPLFALFSVALGMSAVIPDMDPTKPAHVDPTKIIEAVNNQGCTFSFGSPALWNRVTQYCVDNNIKLPSLKNILMAGAPVPVELHARFRKVISEDADTHTPYGATESLPSTNMRGSEVLAETGEMTKVGKGFCVGRPVHGVEVQVIKLTDEAIEEWSDELKLPDGETGEIVTKGGNVTQRYFNNDDATKMSKIKDGEVYRHRIGDMGYRDEKGRFWFCGRKAHRVETEKGILYTVCCEAIFNQDERVRRSALVGVGERPNQTPVIIIEPVEMPKDNIEREKFKADLVRLGEKNEITRDIEVVLFHPSFPVDIRHNAKIFREKLAVWATKELHVAKR